MVSPADVALSVLLLVPATVPRVHEVTCAMPLPFVAIAVGGLTEPPPPVTAKVTPTP